MIKVALACCALALTLLTAPPAQAATPKAGDCYAKADDTRGVVDVSSKVDCAKPHAVQVMNTAKLPAALANQMRVPQVQGSDGALTRPLADLYVKECTGQKTAAGIWPTKGKAVAAALAAGTARFAPQTSAWLDANGWTYSIMLPDQKSWDSGTRTAMCVMGLQDDKAKSLLRPFQGNLRDLETSKALTEFRLCASDRDWAPCSKPHPYEVLFEWDTPTFPAGDFRRWTDAQKAPLLAQCQAGIDVLVGAKRPELKAEMNVGGVFPSRAWGRDFAALGCAVKRADGKLLPAGTVVGLGKKSL